MLRKPRLKNAPTGFRRITKILNFPSENFKLLNERIFLNVYHNFQPTPSNYLRKMFLEAMFFFLSIVDCT